MLAEQLKLIRIGSLRALSPSRYRRGQSESSAAPPSAPPVLAPVPAFQYNVGGTAEVDSYREFASFITEPLPAWTIGVVGGATIGSTGTGSSAGVSGFEESQF
ncbi:unnamed protein product [Strongylus vulgaris]|uniref:Uncharacterized protein n=1 Tax=Strongylus vulgaris TaxID=40348 RepID=A0A3P7J665_STRVU|nr:unnamed protein product [Strongylus vulgaris]